MPLSSQPPETRYPTARERVQARRAALRRRQPRAWQIVLGGALLMLALLGVILLRRADQALRAIQQDDPRRRATPQLSSTASANMIGGPVVTPAALPNGLSAPINLLLIGVDKRPTPDDGVRSDTLILVHLDPQQRWAGMLSIPRDSVVNIPHIGWSKINAAYAYGYANAAELYGSGTAADAGGGALAAETVEQFLNVKVDYTAQVDFQGFAQLVDAIGGVPIDVERPLLDAEYPTDNYGVERVYIPAGLQVLDGRSALIYARSRHASTDFDRSQRQQRVLHALLDQVRARGLLENVAALPAWADVLSQNIRTTLPVRDLGMLNGLATLARELDSSRILQLSINPQDVPMDSEDGSDLYWNQQGVAALVARLMRGPQQPGQETARIQVLNGAAVEGIAGQVSGYLRSKGFELADPGNAEQVYAHTTIIDYSGRPQTRQRLANALGIAAANILTIPGPDAPAAAYGADIVVVVGQDYRPTWAEQQ